MGNKIYRIGLALLLCLGLIAALLPVSAGSKISKAQKRAFLKDSNAFSVTLFQKEVQRNGKTANTLIAPMSVMTALSMSAAGSDGKTASQMKAVLTPSQSWKSLNQSMRWYASIQKTKGPAKLQMANSIWVNKKIPMTIRRGFVKKNKNYYGAGIYSRNFARKRTTGEINGWVKKKTGGTIDKVVDKLPENAAMKLINALYFKARWADPYESTCTRKHIFHAAGGKDQKVAMMDGSEYGYLSGKNVTGFCKPYTTRYSFVALLPDKGISLEDYVASLSGKKLQKLLTGIDRRQKVLTRLPKFKVRYSDDSMQHVLKSMGMTRAFSRQKANFHRMAKLEDPEARLFIDSVIHKSYMKVNEKGTEAGAVTAVQMRVASAAPTAQPKKVYLNRPFLCLIIDNKSKLPVFMGALNRIA